MKIDDLITFLQKLKHDTEGQSRGLHMDNDQEDSELNKGMAHIDGRKEVEKALEDFILTYKYQDHDPHRNA